jgi:hypothetical protein
MHALKTLGGWLLGALATLLALCGPSPAPVLADALPAQTTLTVAVNDAGTGQAWQSPERAGSSASATATIAPAGILPPTGSVTYSLYADNGCSTAAISSETVPLNGDGSVPASRPTGALSPGAYGFQATYTGDALNGAATSSCAPFAVAPAQPVTISASANPTSASYGNTVILSAAGLPSDATGSVTFATDTMNLCSAPVSLGAASCTTAVLPTGDYSVSAAYSGDTAYPPAQAATAFTITPAPTPPAPASSSTTTTQAPVFHFIAPPSIQIAQPVNAARYTRREKVRASYRCADGPDAPGLVSCQGSVAAGARIDTAKPGEHAFSVTGVSRSGESTIRTLHYLVDVPGNRIAVSQPDLRSNGTGAVRVRVPGPGRLTALETAWRGDRPEPEAGHQTVLSRGRLTVRHRGPVAVAVRPVGSGRRLLRRSRGQRLRVRLLVSYTPTGGDLRQLSKYGMLHIR